MRVSILLIAAASVGLASAARIPHRELQSRDGSFKLPRVATGPAANRNLVRDMKAVFKKHDMPISHGLVGADESEWEVNSPRAAPAVARREGTPTGTATGQVANTPLPNDFAYVVPVSIGGQTLHLNFDTGSSDLWVYNTKTGSQYVQASQTSFDPTKSSTWRPLPQASFSVAYGNNAQSITAGTAGTDTVTIGGLSVTGQVVELANQVTQQFVNVPDDGLVGFAHSAGPNGNQLQPTQAKTFFENLAPQLKQPIMGANLKHNTPGSYDFGELDSSAFTGSIQWVDTLTDSPKWAFASSHFAVGGNASTATTSNLPAIADTGSTFMLVEPDTAKAYYAQVQGAQFNATTNQWAFPCSAALPDFHVELVPNTLSTIPGALINYGEAPSGSCGGTLQPISPGSQQQIFGDIMFKAQYVAFNAANNQIGFAPHA